MAEEEESLCARPVPAAEINMDAQLEQCRTLKPVQKNMFLCRKEVFAFRRGVDAANSG